MNHRIPYKVSTLSIVFYQYLYDKDPKLAHLFEWPMVFTSVQELYLQYSDWTNFKKNRFKVYYKQFHMHNEIVESLVGWTFRHNLGHFVIHDGYHIGNEHKMISSSLDDSLQQAADEYARMKVNTERLSGVIHSVVRLARKNPVFKDSNRHFTINSKGQMTFTPAGKDTLLNSDGKWPQDDRQSIKYGKGLRQIFDHYNVKFPDKVPEQLGNILKSKFMFMGKFEIVEGDELKHFYLEENYMPYSGSLNNSCMKYSQCQKYLDVLVDNCSMLIARHHIHTDRIIGRALIWQVHFPRFGEQKHLMDRIYGNEMTINAFKEYAKENDFVHKKWQDYDTPRSFVYNGQEFRDDVYTKVKNIQDYEYLPYLDTFKYYDEDEPLNNHIGTYSCTMTDGNPPHQDDDNYVWIDGDRYSRDEVCYIEREGEYFHQDDCVYSEYYGDYILYNQSEELPCGDYVWEDDEDFVLTYNCGIRHYDDCTEIDGEWYLSNRITVDELHQVHVSEDERETFTVTAENFNIELILTQLTAAQLNNNIQCRTQSWIRIKYPHRVETFDSLYKVLFTNDITYQDIRANIESLTTTYNTVHTFNED